MKTGRLGHDSRLLLLALAAGLPGVATALALLWAGPWRTGWQIGGSFGLALSWIGLAWLVRDRANALAFDAEGHLVARVDAGQLTVHQRISEMADPLHFGYFGGYWTKIPWFLFGLMMTGLSVSGIAIYGLRVGRALPSAGAISTAWRDDPRYDHLYTVEEVNRLVMEGRTFRDAYHEVGRSVAAGTYRPGMAREHTHVGSVGELGSERIREKFEGEWER